MKVRCYPHGDDRHAELFELGPEDAARRYCSKNVLRDDQEIIVEPMDDDARALRGWHDDGDGSIFKMYRVTSETKWEANEVKTFNYRAATSSL